ncbi:MAG: hypothetical protein ACE5I2_04060 [Anaerolineae bacterium]
MTITTKIPEDVEVRFRRKAEQLYGTGETAKALEGAIELWLRETKDDEEIVARERKLNNDAFRRLWPELEKQQGRYVVIAHGKLQGVGDSIESLQSVAPDAHHRLVFKVGEPLPKRRRLGWKVRRKQRKPFAGIAKPSSL